MSATEDAKNVSKNLEAITRRRVDALYALAKDVAARMLQEFRQNQGFQQGSRGAYWTNQTSEAVRTVFAEAFKTPQYIGAFIAHRMLYGVWLELANDRRHEALRPLAEKYGKEFFIQAKKIMGG
jgi:hypothetical protein